MESMTGKDAKAAVTDTAPDRNRGRKAVPNYLKPSTGSCHHVCKYGGHHAFEDKEVCKTQPKPRKQPAVSDHHKRKLIKVGSVSERRVLDFSKPEKANKPVVVKEKEAKIVEWKDIVAYDAVSLPNDTPAGKKRDVMRGKKSIGKITEQETIKKQTESLNNKLVSTVRSKLTRKSSIRPQATNGARENSPSDRNMNHKSVKPLKVKKATKLPAEKKVVSQEMFQGDATTNFKHGKVLIPADQEVYDAAAVIESSRPIPVHRRVQSMSISSRSVRFPFTRQASKNPASIKLRSRSSKEPILTSEEEKPTRLRFRKGRVAAGDESSSGIQLRIRSLRRRGFGGASGAGTRFVVPEVELRHQKTLEKKKSRRLYNNLIEETASKLAKNRKSRVKSLVGAFETLISKIGK